jgi:predicted transcriptional regulator
MARPFPLLSSHVAIEEVYRLLLAGNSAVAVHSDQKIEGIITRSDLITFYESNSEEAEV